MRHQYETIVSEWLVVEAIVRQQDAEALEANQAKLQGVHKTKNLLFFFISKQRKQKIHCAF